MYLVTGGAGFIGSHIVRGLNARGITDIAVVDDMTAGNKFVNLNDCTIADYMDRDELRYLIENSHLEKPYRAIFHQGACTDTMETDGNYMMENNFTFSKLLFHYALTRQIPFIYASSAAVYGGSNQFKEDPANEHPLNVYGYSKLVLDQHIRRFLSVAKNTVVGLRYFNVYGARETQKGRMASMVYQLYKQLVEGGTARLFEGTDGYGNGEQRRDFISVEDVVKVNLFFADSPPVQGIFNLGTGQARSFNDIASTLIRLIGHGKIKYIPFPDDLRGKYQSFTEASVTALREAGYTEDFLSLEEGIQRAFEEWSRPER
jgi:ADP-L-glycero-D-manno-heptose 6-epimerase